MKVFLKRLAVVCITVMAAIILSSGAANAAPTTPYFNPFQPELVNPSTAYCGSAIQGNPKNLAACSAALSENYRQQAGMTTVPKYLYVRYAGVSQLGWGPSGFVACGYQESVTLYCNGSVHLGSTTLSNVLKLDINPEMYAVFLSAHEATHHTQSTTGGKNLFPIFFKPEVKPYELQSDCVAGNAIQYYVSIGRYTAAEAESLRQNLLAIGAGEATHGSGADRALAYQTGLTATSVNSCRGGQFATTALL